MAAYDSRPINLPITAYYKGDFSLDFNFTSGGSPYDISGASAEFVIYSQSGTVKLTLSGGSGLTIGSNSIALAITNTQIVALATQEYKYEFILTLGSGLVWPVLAGPYIVSEAGLESVTTGAVSVSLDGGAITIDVQSPAFLTPSYTTAERDALTATAPMLIYNSDDGKLNLYNGAWEEITSA